MSITRILPAGISTIAISRLLNKNSELQLNDDNQDNTAPSTGNTFGTFRIIGAYITRNENALRQKGYTPANLCQSATNSLAAHQNLRAKMQFATMLKFTPQQEEVAVYEKSGNALSEKGYDTRATRHWMHAFSHMHRPYDMTERLGHNFMTENQLGNAQMVFEHQVAVAPADPVAHNELGVTRFMSALAQNDFQTFMDHKLTAMSLFKKSSELNPCDRVAPLNNKVASLLSINPFYGRPARYLTPEVKKPTSMIDAISKDLDEHRSETKSDTAVGWTLTENNKGQSTIEPTFTNYSYKVPRISNQMALCELAKLKAEEYESAAKQIAPPSF